MLALSRKEPYGSLMLYGKIETRTWSTNYRGPVLICCSQKGYADSDVKNRMTKEQYAQMQKLLSGKELHHGYAIAVGNLVECRPMRPEDEKATFVVYNPALRCHIYEDVKAIDPIPFKGAQRWKKVDNDTISLIQYI